MPLGQSHRGQGLVAFAGERRHAVAVARIADRREHGKHVTERERTGVARDPQVGEESARLERHMQARPAVKVEAVARGTVPDVAAQIRIVLAQQGVKHPDGQFVFDARLAWR